jgi:hypothetical protein
MGRGKKGVVPFPSIAHQTIEPSIAHQVMEPSKGDQVGIFFHPFRSHSLEKGENGSFGTFFP